MKEEKKNYIFIYYIVIIHPMFYENIYELIISHSFKYIPLIEKSNIYKLKLNCYINFTISNNMKMKPKKYCYNTAINLFYCFCDF